MTRPTSLVAALSMALLLLAGPVAPARAEPAAPTTATRTRVEMELTTSSTKRLLRGDNKVFARGRAHRTKVGRQIHLFFPYRQPGQRAGIAILDGQIAFTGDGPEVRLRQLRVDFRRRLITGLTVKGGRRPMFQLITIHTTGHTPTRAGRADRDRADRADRAAFKADTILILTDTGAFLLNHATVGAPFVTGDVFARATGLS